MTPSIVVIEWSDSFTQEFTLAEFYDRDGITVGASGTAKVKFLDNAGNEGVFSSDIAWFTSIAGDHFVMKNPILVDSSDRLSTEVAG